MCTYSFHGYFVFFLVITLDNHERPKKDDKFFQLYFSAGGPILLTMCIFVKITQNNDTLNKKGSIVLVLSFKPRASTYPSDHLG